MNEQELVTLHKSKEYKEAKKAYDAEMAKLLTPEQIKKQQRQIIGAIELPEDEEFTFVSYENIYPKDENGVAIPSMNHVRLTTDTGHTVSVGRILELALVGDAMEEPTFKPTPSLQGMALLNGVLPVSPSVSNWMSRTGVTKYNFALEVVQRKTKFTAQKVVTKTYYPSTKGEEIRGAKAIKELNLSDITHRNSLCKVRETYELTVVEPEA